MLNATFISECSSVGTFPSNPDITGIGVRTALYASLLLGFIRARLFPYDMEDYRASSRLSLVTSTALTAASLYSLYHPNLGLSLLDAQIVALFIFTISACNYSLLYYDIGFTTRVAAQLHLFLSASFGIILYANPSAFGGASHQPECLDNSEFTYILFGKMSATNKGLQVVSLLICCGALSEFLWRGRGRFFIACIRIVVWFWEMPTLQAIARIAIHIRAGTLGGKARPMVQHAIASWLGLGMTIYLIATVECMIVANDLPTFGNVNAWTFGQTVALLMVFDQVVKVMPKVITLIRLWWRRKHPPPLIAAQGDVSTAMAGNGGAGGRELTLSEETLNSYPPRMAVSR